MGNHSSSELTHVHNLPQGCLGKVRFIARVQTLSLTGNEHASWVPKGLHFATDISKARWNANGCLLVRADSPDPAEIWINYGKTRLHEIRTKSYAKRSPAPPEKPISKHMFPLRVPSNLPLNLIPNGNKISHPGVPMIKGVPTPRQLVKGVPTPRQLVKGVPTPRPLVKRKRSNSMSSSMSNAMITEQPHSPEMNVPKYFPTPKRPYNHPATTRQWSRNPYKQADWRPPYHVSRMGLEPPPMLYHY